MSAILYNGKAEIGLSELAQIYLTLITTSDSIWINYNIEATRNPSTSNSTIEHIEKSINYLTSKNLIKRWSFPDNTPSQNVKNLTVLEDSDYEEAAIAISNTFLKNKDLYSLMDVKQAPDGEIIVPHEERTSKIIGMRKEYTALAVASMLDISQLLNNYGGWSPDFTLKKESVFEDSYKPLVDEMFNIMKVPNISNLNGKDIAKLNNKSYALKNLLDDVLSKSNTNDTIKGDIDDNITGIVTQLNSDLSDIFYKNANSVMPQMIKNSFYAIAGLLLPPVSIIPIANQFLEWLKEREKYSYLYYLAQIRKSTEK